MWAVLLIVAIFVVLILTKKKSTGQNNSDASDSTFPPKMTREWYAQRAAEQKAKMQQTQGGWNSTDAVPVSISLEPKTLDDHEEWEAAKARLDREYLETIREAAKGLCVNLGAPDPVRGFCNYDYFTVRGRKPSTGRMNTRHIAAFSEAEAREIAIEKEQLAEPLEVTLEGFHAPRPSEYGLAIPRGASEDDYMAMEGSALDRDTVPVTPGLYSWLTVKHIRASRLMGINYAVKLLAECMTDEERVELYAYIVDCSRRGLLPGDLTRDPNRGKYKTIVAASANQADVLKSVRENISKSVANPNSRTKAYQFVSQFL